MKKFLCLLVIPLLMVSCSSNDVKLTVAEQIKVVSKGAIEKELVKSCDATTASIEAEKLSSKLQSEVEKLLKVEASAQKSFVGDVAQFVCKSFIEKAIPSLLEQNYDQYECAMKRFYDRSEDLSELVCSKIKL